MKNLGITAVCAVALTAGAHATTITTVDPTADPSGTAAALAAATLAPGSGISIIAGSETYVGEPGQGGTYSDFSISNGSTTIALAHDGIVLTSGDAGGILVAENTDPSFDGSLGTPGNALLETLTPSTTFDANVLSFEFAVEPGMTSVSASFVFGTDEYPDQSVTDIFGVFVDGVNYAEFSDGSVINFELGSISAGFFNDNDVGSLTPFVTNTGDAIQYDGILSVLTVTGLLDLSLTTHMIVIAIADTSDTIFDSGVFFGGLMAGTATGGGITPTPEIPLPAGGLLMLTGLGALTLRGLRKI
ncbi:choice-of-anchor L domain-containing protein [Amphiplicatus metriothermophilus]|uniref:VPLPA-CTERM protein sorting domain-containing protein n=1 Tax=Amphiplicatus metriothermophilus TaxID=1519374 RepID=A0A239PVY2_9PROT|nr:choice-of-anchor L domain-containing protein [Amphiplicatus metriothermophilus]MBB5519535.1 hypothetical protein [Amphiplicatus metriothermophilus]SNT74102.1 VPLPA-CTERM protein sorting domain-containing protein [Amphiplicatus metriothermophilus]